MNRTRQKGSSTRDKYVLAAVFSSSLIASLNERHAVKIDSVWVCFWRHYFIETQWQGLTNTSTLCRTASYRLCSISEACAAETPAKKPPGLIH